MTAIDGKPEAARKLVADSLSPTAVFNLPTSAAAWSGSVAATSTVMRTEPGESVRVTSLCTRTMGVLCLQISEEGESAIGPRLWDGTE